MSGVDDSKVTSDEHTHLAAFRLDGRVALVTGSTKGLERSIAGGRAAAGSSVVVSGRNEDECEIVASPARIIGSTADIG